MEIEEDKKDDDLQTFLAIIKMPHLFNFFISNNISLKELMSFKNEDLEKVLNFNR